jgi:hypothetical protein
MNGTEKELAFLHICSITMTFGLKSEICKPTFGMEEDITVRIMPHRLFVGHEGSKHRLRLAHDIPKKAIPVRLVIAMFARGDLNGGFFVWKCVVEHPKRLRSHL